MSLKSRGFLQSSHVHHRRFDHTEGLGLEDVGMVAGAQLKEVADELGLEGWPTEALKEKFVERSEGLMIWVVGSLPIFEGLI